MKIFNKNFQKFHLKILKNFVILTKFGIITDYNALKILRKFLKSNTIIETNLYFPPFTDFFLQSFISLFFFIIDFKNYFIIFFAYLCNNY